MWVWSIVFLRYMEECTTDYIINDQRYRPSPILGNINISPQLFRLHREIPPRTDDITAGPQGLQSSVVKGAIDGRGVRGQVLFCWIGCFICINYLTSKNCVLKNVDLGLFENWEPPNPKIFHFTKHLKPSF